MLDFRETETETSCKLECFEHRSLMSRLRSHKIALQSPTIVKMLMKYINMLFVFFLVASNSLKEIYITEAIFLLSKMASIHRTNYPCHEKSRSQSFTLCNNKYSS